MPVSVRFEADNHLVIWTFTGSWTWEDYYSNRDQVNQTITATEHAVNMIIDMTGSQLLPKNLMTHAGSAARRAPNNIGKTIFVGNNAILRVFFNMFSQLYGVMQAGKQMETHMVSSLEEAYQLLREPDLPTAE